MITVIPPGQSTPQKGGDKSITIDTKSTKKKDKYVDSQRQYFQTIAERMIIEAQEREQALQEERQAIVQ